MKVNVNVNVSSSMYTSGGSGGYTTPMKRWMLLLVLWILAGCRGGEEAAPGVVLPPPWVPDEPTLASLHRALTAGETTCAAEMEARLDRIARFELDTSDGPPLNAFVTLNASLREQAAALDAAFAKTGQLVGPLHCVPFVVKTNFATDEVDVTNGVFGLRGLKAPQGRAVTRLKQKGALLVGSTAMDEFARGIYGIGGAHGRTGNAFSPHLSPGGSSAGSAVAVAAGFALAGLGTDNCGSLVIPAAYNGLVTLRGSRHRIPLDGIFPGNPRDTVAGPLARTVTDLAVLLDAMAGTPGEHTGALARDALVGKRIGVVRALSKKTKEKYRFPYATKSPAVSAAWDTVFQDLERLGATVVEDVALPKLDARRRFGGWAQAVQEFLATTDPPMTFEDLCDAEGYSAMVWPDAATCRADLKKRLARSLADPDPRYTQNAAWVQARMDKLKLDALLLPSDAHGIPRARKSSPNCMLTSVTGLPSATVVGGWAEELPVGMQFVGREGGDLAVLGLAFAFEQGTRHRKAPDLIGPEAAPPLDLAASNLLHAALGQRAFEQVLHHGARKDLNAQVFADLAAEVLQEAGQSPGVP